jgi:O-antigen/teichoic acid export membrane protein
MSPRKSAIWLLTGNTLFLVVQFAGSVVIARLLSPGETGVFAIAMAATWLLHALQNLGLSAYVIRERFLPKQKLGTVITVCLLQGLLLASAFWLVAPLLAKLVHDPRVCHALRILCLYALVLPLRGTLGGLFQRQLRLDRFALVSMFDVGVSALVAVVGAYAGLSYASMVWGAVAGLVGSTLLSIWWLRAELRVPLTLAYWREAWSFGGAMLLTVLINNLGSRAPELMIGRTAGVSAVGLFNRGAGLVQMLSGPLVASAQRLLQPLLVQSRERSGSMRVAYLRSISITTGVLWPALAGLAVLAAPVITLIYGRQWVSAAPVLSLVAVAAIVDVALFARSEVLIASGQEKLLSRLEIISSVVGLALLAASVQFGLMVAAASRIPSMLATVLIYARPIARATGCRGREILDAAASSAVPTIAAVGPAVALMTWLGWPHELAAAQFAGAVLAGVIGWLVAIFAVAHELRTETEGWVRIVLKVPRSASTAGELS